MIAGVGGAYFGGTIAGWTRGRPFGLPCHASVRTVMALRAAHASQGR